MRNYSDEGIVIKRHDLGEADRLLTIYTKNSGKKTYIAKGVRKISSKRAGSIELFNHIKLSAIKGKADIDILGEIEVIDSHGGWKTQLGRVTLAYQLAETVDKLTPDQDPNIRLFILLKNGLSQIGTFDKNWESQTQIWLISVMKELGFWSEEEFTGDIHEFIENVSARSFQSAKLLNRLRT